MLIEEHAEALAQKMSAQLRVRGTGLAEVTERAGRKLPRRLRADAQTIIQAEAMGGHPKLSRLVDERAVMRATRRIERFLDKKDPKGERWGELLDLIAKIAFVLVTIVLVVFFWLLNRGYFE